MNQFLSVWIAAGGVAFSVFTVVTSLVLMASQASQMFAPIIAAAIIVGAFAAVVDAASDMVKPHG